MVDTIPFTRLLYLLLPLLATAYFYYRWTDQKWELAYATLRMIVQLIAIGYALVFLFQDESYGMGLAVILVMMAMSSWIAIRPIQRQKRALLSPTLLAVGLSGTVMLFLLIGPVLALDPLYQPRLVIPLAGMIYSNAMNTISLAGERYFTECDSGISSDRARSQAYRAALSDHGNGHDLRNRGSFRGDLSLPCEKNKVSKKRLSSQKIREPL